MSKRLFSVFPLIAIMAVFFISSPPEAHSQVTPLKTLTISKTALTNVDTSDMTVSKPKGFIAKAGVFQVTLVKGTGTLAGTIVLEASTNGVDYGLLGANTYTITDIAKKVKVFQIAWPETAFTYYRLRVLPTGTQTSTVSAAYAQFF